MTTTDPVLEAINAVYIAESRRVLATLMRLLGDFELAEEARHETLLAAVEQWPRDGVPGNSRAWLVSAGRFKAIDTLRKRARFDASLDDYQKDGLYKWLHTRTAARVRSFARLV